MGLCVSRSFGRRAFAACARLRNTRTTDSLRRYGTACFSIVWTRAFAACARLRNTRTTDSLRRYGTGCFSIVWKTRLRGLCASEPQPIQSGPAGVRLKRDSQRHQTNRLAGVRTPAPLEGLPSQRHSPFGGPPRHTASQHPRTTTTDPVPVRFWVHSTLSMGGL